MELMATSCATAKLTELPLRSSLPLSFSSPRHLPFLRPLSFLRNDTSHELSTSVEGNRDHNSNIGSSWIREWPSSSEPALSVGRTAFTPVDKHMEDRTRSRQLDASTKTAAIDRIVLRLQNLGLRPQNNEKDEDEMDDTKAILKREDKMMRNLLRRDWAGLDRIIDPEDVHLPWEAKERSAIRKRIGMKKKKKKKPHAPTRAELNIEVGLLTRLRRDASCVRDYVTVPQAGVTDEVLEKIHNRWKEEELVQLKFHEVLTHRMLMARQLVERRTGGFVIRRCGKYMIVFRGVNYEGPAKSHIIYGETGTVFLNDATAADKLENAKIIQKRAIKNLSGEEAEYQSFLDELGPRFTGWWGIGMPPIDADLLPEVIPGYKTPFRFVPRGVRRGLTATQLRNLRRLSKHIPSHFALSRNRNHQGLAAALIKLWERTLVAKIVIKRGVLQTSNKLMALELKMLTGGTLLIRNKYYIVIYRGRDFVPSGVMPILEERAEFLEQAQDEEERIRSKTFQEAWSDDNEDQVRAGTLAESNEAHAQWGGELSAEDHAKVLKEAFRARTLKLLMNLERRLRVVQMKKFKALKNVNKVNQSMFPAPPPGDNEILTDEERSLYRRIGIRMAPFLSMGIRGVFDGLIENMHLHWKFREVVKLICYHKDPTFVQKSAKFLEYESGGILVCIENVPKGYALIFYRGKNYRLPPIIRPTNLLRKGGAYKLRIAMQRYSSFATHMCRLEKLIEKHRSSLNSCESGDSTAMKLVKCGESMEDEDFDLGSDDAIDQNPQNLVRYEEVGDTSDVSNSYDQAGDRNDKNVVGYGEGGDNLAATMSLEDEGFDLSYGDA